MKCRFNAKSLLFEGFLNGDWLPITKGFYGAVSVDNLRTIDRYRIEVSLVCNLRCAYCVVHMNSVEQQNTLMSTEVATKIVDKFNNEVGDRGSIFLMGGEPLTNEKVIRQIIESANGNIIIFTNALRLTDEVSEYFLNNNVYILTSLDGSTSKQNTKRFFPNVEQNFQTVTGNIKTAISKGCKVGVSCLLHRDNIFDAVNIASYFVNELQAKAMSFAYPHLTLKDSEENDFDIIAYGEQLIKLYEFSKANKVYIDQIGKIISAIVFGNPIIAGCKAGLNQRTFYPDGSETICTKLDTCKSYDIEHYFYSLPYFNALCQDCIAVSVCGGGCAWDACVCSGKNELDFRICKYRVPLVQHIINDIISTLESTSTLQDAQSVFRETFIPLCKNY